MLSLADASSTSTSRGSTNPFPGPKPYRQEDQAFFFGREEERDELTSLVLSTSAVVMDAPSGTGKSSLINAGLLPALEPYGFTVVPVRFGEHARAMREATATPGGNPFEAAVMAAIEQVVGAPPSGSDLTMAMDGLRKEGAGGYVLLLDQFEEIFAGFPGSWRQRTPFFRSLARGLELNCTLRLLIAIRSDYLASLAPYQRQLPGELVVRYSLESLRADGAKEAIRRAFRESGRPLSDDAIDGLVTGLLTLWSGETRLDVEGEFVNLIQLQIVCRGHWETAADVGTHEIDGANPACVDVESAMNAFVDTAISHTVAETGSDECTIRAWLESELITPGDRRAVVLVGETTTGGLPNDIVDVLDRRRLVAYQQRNDDQWVELTHDSMIRGIRRSNGRWHEARRRRQLRRRNRLALLLVVLVGLFLGLRRPAAETTEQETLAARDDVLTESPERLEFSAPPEHVTLVSARVTMLGDVPGDEDPSLRVVPGDGGPAIAAQVETALDDDGSGAHTASFDLSFKPTVGGSYAAVLEPGGAIGSAFELTASAVPIAITAEEANADHVEMLDRETFAVEVPPGAPLLVAVEDGFIDDASGAHVINDSEAIVVSADDKTSYAVLSVSTYGRRRVHTSRLDDDLGDLALGEERRLTDTEDAVSLPFDNPDVGPVVIGAACPSGDGDVIVYDESEQVVASTATATPGSYGSRSGAFVVVTLPPGSYHAVFAANEYETVLGCTVGALGVASHTLTAPLQRMLPFAAGSNFAAFLVESTGETIAVVDGASGVDHSLHCGTSGRTTLPGDDGRLVAVVSPDADCAIVLQHNGERVEGHVRARLIPLPSATEAQP